MEEDFVVMPSLLLSQREYFQEVAGGHSKEEAVAEAERYLNCGVPVIRPTRWCCLPAEVGFLEEALYLEILYLLG